MYFKKENSSKKMYKNCIKYGKYMNFGFDDI